MARLRDHSQPVHRQRKFHIKTFAPVQHRYEAQFQTVQLQIVVVRLDLARLGRCTEAPPCVLEDKIPQDMSC